VSKSICRSRLSRRADRKSAGILDVPTDVQGLSRIGVADSDPAGRGLDGERGLGVDVRGESENERRDQSSKNSASVLLWLENMLSSLLKCRA